MLGTVSAKGLIPALRSRQQLLFTVNVNWSVYLVTGNLWDTLIYVDNNEMNDLISKDNLRIYRDVHC